MDLTIGHQTVRGWRIEKGVARYRVWEGVMGMCGTEIEEMVVMMMGGKGVVWERQIEIKLEEGGINRKYSLDKIGKN